MSPQQARDKLAALNSDAEWVKGLLAGDADKVQQNNDLHQIGYSTEVVANLDSSGMAGQIPGMR
jgi:hypothetical protein